ncbi:MAG TPA: hypothetical protein VFY20_09065 [Gemmatimonadales bacterium]|nr:hypothetical protein [Gemmatimonadales bacterium]
MLDRILDWLSPHAAAPATTTPSAHEVRGLPVAVLNSRPDIRTADVLARLDRSLGLLERHVPWHFRRLRRDFSRLLVVRYPCRGAYDPNDGTCIVELTFCVNPRHEDAEVAATILHEAMHARLHAAGLPLDFADRARQERFCRRAELEFGRLVPGGEVVLERAQATLAFADEEVAPMIDWRVAEQRIAAADAAALGRRDRA